MAAQRAANSPTSPQPSPSDPKPRRMATSSREEIPDRVALKKEIGLTSACALIVGE
uniref:Uncharacterized protein n=1 Tax=Callorhinchus milii TaxID=7868 RepID=A0A4W3JYH1_CALMI